MFTLRAKTLARLREQMRRLEKPGSADRPVVEFGAAEIDDELPAGGLAAGCLHEIAACRDDAAAHGFAAWLLGRAMGEAGVALWCRARGRGGGAAFPYGPGLARFGLATDRLIVARASGTTDALWALEEALRSGRFAAVLGENVTPDLTATRRLQLAAEAGGTMALLLTGDGANRLSAATTRWRVVARATARPDRPCWRLSLERCRGGGRGAWMAEWGADEGSDEALRLHISAALADGPLAPAS
jgi:protein ImuA